MGKIYTISGPSGVGKTTFFLQLFKIIDETQIKLIPRYTNRPKREDEVEGFEYYFTSYNGLLQKVSSNDFIHFEKWGDYYSGIETELIEDVIQADYDGLILASSFGASRLKATFGDSIQPIYVWTGESESLKNPRSLEKNSPEITELKWRIAKKINESAFSEFEIKTLTDDAFLDKRMVDNYLDIASVQGRIRDGEDYHILPNLNNQVENAVKDFLSLRTTIKQDNPTETGNINLNRFCSHLAKKRANFFLTIIVVCCIAIWLSFLAITYFVEWDKIEPKLSVISVPLLSLIFIFLWFMFTGKELSLNPKKLYNSIKEHYEEKYKKEFIANRSEK